MSNLSITFIPQQVNEISYKIILLNLFYKLFYYIGNKDSIYLS